MGKKRKLRGIWPSSTLGVQGGTLRTSFHFIRWKYASFVRRTTPLISVQPYLSLKPCTKEWRHPLNLFTSSTNRGRMDPDLTSRGCKGHPKLIITPTNRLLCLPGSPCSPFLVYASSMVLLPSIPFSTHYSLISLLWSATASVECTSTGVEAPIHHSSCYFSSTTTSSTTITPCSSKKRLTVHSLPSLFRDRGCRTYQPPKKTQSYTFVQAAT